MKKYLFLCAVILLAVSCSHTSRAVQYPDMVADIEPFSIGSVNLSLDQAFSSTLRNTSADVVFYPRENEVALEFDNKLGQYQLFWNKEARQLFIEASNRYKDDFANQNLTTKYSKSRVAYGKIKNRLQWKTIKFSGSYRSSPVTELGYRFVDKAPYFITRQNTATEETKTNKDLTSSPNFTIYFTRAQAEDLAQLFDDTFLRNTVRDVAPPPAASTYRDEY